MARIRTIKPELFVSESLAAVSLTAERTFVGLLTQADDQGRFRDHPAIIAGVLWPLRREHTPVHVDEDLQQLDDVGLICRYIGCDGRAYLHLVTWNLHQKINRPSASRIPSCPRHNSNARCATCKTTPCTGTAVDGSAPGGLHESSLSPHDTLTAPSTAQEPPRAPGPTPATATRQLPAAPPGHEPTSAQGNGKTADQSAAVPDSVSPHGGLTESSLSGSRTLDLGPRTLGRAAPAPDDPAPALDPSTAPESPQGATTARELVAEYVDACAHRPPDRVVGHLLKETATLLGQGIDPDHVRAGLERVRSKALHPSTLASAVNEVLNPPTRTPADGYRPWTNPTDPETAYKEAL